MYFIQSYLTGRGGGLVCVRFLQTDHNSKHCYLYRLLRSLETYGLILIQENDRFCTVIHLEAFIDTREYYRIFLFSFN